MSDKQPTGLAGNEPVHLRIRGGKELKGIITLKTSKNAAVGLLCASLLNHGVTTLRSIPRIEEVFRMVEVLESIGVEVMWLPENDLEIRRPEKLLLENLDGVAAGMTRSVLLLIGSLMHEADSFRIPFAGGCKLGDRTVEPHLLALKEFGADIVATEDSYHVTTSRQSAPERIALYEAGDTVTENALLAAACSDGETQIDFASANYMVQDLCFFLQELGVKVEGIGTSSLRITGVSHVRKNATYSPAEDPIEAMFFIAAAVTTNSEITIRRVSTDFVTMELLKLRKMGLGVTETPRYKAENGQTDLVDLTVHKHDGQLRALTDKIHPLPYPGLNADNLPYFVPIAAVARGFLVTGPTEFEPADVACPPALRPASLLLIGMLAAPGTSTLRNVYPIERGYEDLAGRLNTLGADITAQGDASK
ncbi:putative UDP-N-acetylglucosamine 1-carboxyvinyltransferase [Coniochaeta sp. 2T2.1]|nr:putative UDP-N-acetylglucosamine 1-carboxyvinyltransferase [Coniochaeta sp. 2T2.1]